MTAQSEFAQIPCLKPLLGVLRYISSWNSANLLTPSSASVLIAAARERFSVTRGI